MRNFLSSFLGGLAALIVFFTGLTFLGLVFVIVIASQGAKERVTQVEDGAYVVFKLNTNITDAPAQLELSDLASDRGESLQLRSVLRAIRAAGNDSRIGGILLTGSLSPSGYGCSYAALKELRQTIEGVRKTGKPVIAYLTDADTKDYYLASAASEILLDPYGVIMMPGLAARPTFYAGVFENFGIGVQYTRVGKYKSAIEPFIRKDLSPENREQLSKLLGDLWGDMLKDITESRGLKVAELQGLVDKETLFRGEVALRTKLVDRVAYRDQLIDDLKKRTGRTKPSDTFKQIALDDYMKAARYESTTQGSLGKVAVIYAEGEIVDGQGERGQIGGERFAKEIRKLRNDDRVKAIVLRVNSPGGSATASEHIQREIRLAREKKPVVVSMGGYAASGGYWISAYSNRIFAEPSTITGSIGVFGLFFDVEKLSGKVGLTFDTVKTGAHADSMTITRPKTQEELALIQKLIDWIYDEFIGKVAEGRKLDEKMVREIAQGRVWSGSEALKLGLVDEIGGLEAAIRYAGKEAGLGENPVVLEYPAKKELSEVIAEMFDKIQPVSAKDRSLVGTLEARLQEEIRFLRSCNDPRGCYALMPLLHVE